MSHHHLEIEYKTLLSPSEYQRLLTEFSGVLPIHQTNYYIDTPQFDLRQKRLSLRIRTLSNHAELTLKVPQDIGAQEYNQPLGLQEAHALVKDFQLPDGDIARYLQSLPLSLEPLQVWGSLLTTRYEKQTSIGLMALDKNHYANQIDYELEVEVHQPEEGKVAFDHYLKRKGITYKYARSKIVRAAQQLTNSPASRTVN